MHELLWVFATVALSPLPEEKPESYSINLETAA